VADERGWLPDEVIVPNVLGMLVDDARRVAQAAGVVLAQPDPDGPPLGGLTWRLPVFITSQAPPAGSVLRRHESVVVTWGSEESGVREPRRPHPKTMTGFEESSDAQGESDV
jgi:beta-lactam-binding protein with PASTA domain